MARFTRSVTEFRSFFAALFEVFFRSFLTQECLEFFSGCSLLWFIIAEKLQDFRDML